MNWRVLLPLLLSGCSLSGDNDFFTLLNQDKYYSNGITFSAPLRDGSLSAHHKIFTPQNKRTTELQERDRPYVGLAAVEYLHTIESDSVVDTYSFMGGMVGPSAFGEEVQNGFHDLIANKHAEGWDNQIRDEPILNVGITRTLRGYNEMHGPLEILTYAHSGVNGGNYLSDLHLGGEAQAVFNKSTHSMTLGAIVKNQIKAIDITLDGNSWKHSHSVDKEVLVGRLSFIAAYSYDRFFIAYTYTLVTPEFSEQESGYHWGGVRFGWGWSPRTPIAFLP